MPMQEVYLFKGIPNLYSDVKGNFFYQNKPAPLVYNNGSISVLCGKSKRGIIKLRTLAYKSFIEIDNLPF
jgi:hypothetical protein